MTFPNIMNIDKILQNVYHLVVRHPLGSISIFLGMLGIYGLYRYRHAVTNRIRQMEEESFIFGAGLIMERKSCPTKSSDHGLFSGLRFLEIEPTFRKYCEDEGWNVMSLGEYMRSLQPKILSKQVKTDDLPDIVRKEIEAGLALALLKVLGPNMGRAFLPAVGAAPIQSKAESFASVLVTKWFLGTSDDKNSNTDKAALPVSLLALLSLSELNAKLNSGKETQLKDMGNLKGTDKLSDLPHPDVTAMDRMMQGEVVAGPSFVDEVSAILIPQDFIVSEHFDRAICEMELRLEKGESFALESTELRIARAEIAPGCQKTIQNIKYDPDDRRMEDPVPINPRLLPGLHLGWGKALSSHTKREVLKMRLLSILLNKLGSNYYKLIHGNSCEVFRVKMDATSDESVTTPWGFIQALQKSGHEISVIPTSRLTSFGMGLCVKEESGSWTNIPLGVFIESGYEDRDGRMVPVMMPHSGLDMSIKGPLAGKRADGTQSELSIQHFIGIEGFAGWKNDANPVVPFIESVPRGELLTGTDAVRASRIAGLYAVVLNALATDLQLPFGGYGTAAVCNDSAAIVQQCLYGKNTIYPLTSIGRFMFLTMRYAKNYGEKLEDLGMTIESEEMANIVEAMKKLPSDVNATPMNAENAASRILGTLPLKLPFALMNHSKDVMVCVCKEHAVEKKPKQEMIHKGGNN